MSDFEGKSWPELHAMIANAKPGDFHDRAGKLADAADHMQDLSDQLTQNMRTVEWEGESGDAFRSWTQQLATTTSDFATYTQGISTGLSTVGTHLGTTQSSIPQPPDNVITASQYTQYQPALNVATDYLEAPETNEAINAMSSLSSTYSTTASDFRAAPPVFKPLPAEVIPNDLVKGGGRNVDRLEVSETSVAFAVHFPTRAVVQSRLSAGGSRSGGGREWRRDPHASGTQQPPVTRLSIRCSTLPPLRRLTPRQVSAGNGSGDPKNRCLPALPALGGYPGEERRAHARLASAAGIRSGRRPVIPGVGGGEEGITGGTAVGVTAGCPGSADWSSGASRNRVCPGLHAAATDVTRRPPSVAGAVNR